VSSFETFGGAALRGVVVADPAADHRLVQLAKRSAVSELHLRRMFADQTGTTPARFIERIRVEAAREQLESATTPIETVAASCGFGSPETMRRAFLRILGVGPSDYRARFRSTGNQELAARRAASSSTPVGEREGAYPVATR